ncbi:MAG: TetR family transcriptional regulator C-terminal domain-containing protein [Hyphomicrobiales bacterium]
MSQARPTAPRKTRIQAQNEELILAAALEVFSASGYRGSTVDQIASRCGLSKPNLLYYFRRKEDIYLAVLEKILAEWGDTLQALDPDGDPIEEISAYIRRKLSMSRENPQASRLFANEILSGGGAIRGFLEGPIKTLLDEKAKVIGGWMREGRLAAMDPHHLIIAIWATTQHYADFEVQVRTVLAERTMALETAERTLVKLFCDGLRPRGP